MVHQELKRTAATDLRSGLQMHDEAIGLVADGCVLQQSGSMSFMQLLASHWSLSAAHRAQDAL